MPLQRASCVAAACQRRTRAREPQQRACHRVMETAVRQALSCCCLVGDQTDAHQISYPGDPKLEEGRNIGPLLLPNSGPGNLGKASPGNLGLGPIEPVRSRQGASFGAIPNSSRSVGSAPSSARSSLTPEERQKEKERLQDMVKEFAKCVVQGQQCQWLPNAMGAPRPATYSFDKALKVFSLVPDDSPPVSFDMMKIQEVTKDLRETPFAELLQLPTPHALAGDELERRFVCVQHEENGGGPRHLGLLMPNPYERERFYTCMKILRWAMDSRRERS